MGLQCLETGLLQLNSESILLYGAVGVKSACSYQIQSICCDKPRLFHFRAQLQNCTNFNHCKSHMNQNESWIKHPQSAHWQWHFWVLMIFSIRGKSNILQLHKQQKNKFANKKHFGNVLSFPFGKRRIPNQNLNKRPPRVVRKKSTVVMSCLSRSRLPGLAPENTTRVSTDFVAVTTWLLLFLLLSWLVFWCLFYLVFFLLFFDFSKLFPLFFFFPDALQSSVLTASFRIWNSSESVFRN